MTLECPRMNVPAKCLEGACRGRAADLRIIFTKHTKPGAHRKRLAIQI